MVTLTRADDRASWEGAEEDQATFQKLTRRLSEPMPTGNGVAARRAVHRQLARKRPASKTLRRIGGIHRRRNRKPLQ